MFFFLFAQLQKVESLYRVFAGFDVSYDQFEDFAERHGKTETTINFILIVFEEKGR